jgi:hypothetical protein
MSLLRAFYTDTVDQYIAESKGPDLEPLELSKPEEHAVIARIKKLARDPNENFPNALALVHKGYEEPQWEKDGAGGIGDLVRPTPADRAAWEQYEEFIKLAVKLLAKYRGAKGDWRTDRFDLVTTNHRASMGSMAAARVVEQVSVHWKSLSDLNIVCEELLPNDGLFRNDCIVTESGLDAVADKLAMSIAKTHPDYIVAEGNQSPHIMEVIIYDKDCDVVDVAVLREAKGLDVKTPNVESLAKKYKVSVKEVERQLRKGIKVELEHSTSSDIAKEIALDHINEFLDYYDRLQKMEKQAETESQSK